MYNYQLPQEIEVWYIIPAIRRRLARRLTKEHGLSYDKTAKILGLTKAAISQYVNNKRASKIKLDVKVEKEIDKSARVVNEDSETVVLEIMRILEFMRRNKISFELCDLPAEKASNCKEVQVYEKYWKK